MNRGVKENSYVRSEADNFQAHISSITTDLKLTRDDERNGLASIGISPSNNELSVEPLNLPSLQKHEMTESEFNIAQGEIVKQDSLENQFQMTAQEIEQQDDDIVENGFQITTDMDEDDDETTNDDNKLPEPLIASKIEQCKYNKEKLQIIGQQVTDWFENTGVSAAVVTYFDGHIRVIAPDHMEPLKRNAEFKEIFLKTMLQSPLPGKNHKKMTVVAQDDESEDESPVSCKICQKSFIKLSQLKSHQLLMHLPKEASEHRCEKCGKVFQAAAFLQTHLCNRPGQRDHECNLCGKRFTSGSSLKMHLRIHSEDRPFKCRVCGKGFPRKSSLTYHLTKHTGEKDFQCRMCGKKFALLNNLKDHERIHTGEKPYSCLECGKSFTVSSTLRRHLLIHSGEKPFPCGVCSSRFTRLIHLQSHMRIHSGEKPFKCDECDKKFAQSSHLRRHKKIHERERQACEKCGREMKNREGVLHLCPVQSVENPLRQLPTLQFCNLEKQFIQARI